MIFLCKNCGIVDMAWKDDGSSGDAYVTAEQAKDVDYTLRCYLCLDFTVEVVDENKEDAPPKAKKVKVFKSKSLKDFEKSIEGDVLGFIRALDQEKLWNECYD